MDEILADIETLRDDYDDIGDNLGNAASSECLDDVLAKLDDAKYAISALLQEVSELIWRTKMEMKR